MEQHTKGNLDDKLSRNQYKNICKRSLLKFIDAFGSELISYDDNFLCILDEVNFKVERTDWNMILEYCRELENE